MVGKQDRQEVPPVQWPCLSPQDSGLQHADWTSACKNLLPGAVFIQELVTKDTLAQENARGSWDEDALSGWLLEKHSGPTSHSLETRNHHDNGCKPMTPTTCLQGTGGREPRPPAPALSSGAAAPLVLVLENTLHSVLLPAELLCRLSKKGGQESVRGAEWAWNCTMPSMQWPAWPGHAAKTAL